ncbi:hypothetical protein DXB15_14490 [Roseburia sp. OM02-15]|nr:hypothetical protein DXB15_14490 [Roseburia sp. OM02-15]
MVLRRPERSVECSDSEKKMSACADQNHAPSLTCVRLEFLMFGNIQKISQKCGNLALRQKQRMCYTEVNKGKTKFRDNEVG